MALSGSTVLAALAAVGAVGGQLRKVDELAAAADAALRQAPAGLTASGAASWLATQAQESDYFRATEEYAKNGRYAPHIGRTFEMVTWDYNYLAFGRWCKARGLVSNERTFVDNPKSLADYRWAWLGGVWYFEANDLWPIANAGDHFKVSQIVNGGMGMVRDGRTPNHWGARKKMFEAFLRAGDALLPTGGAHALEEDDVTPEDIEKISQRAAQLVWAAPIEDLYTPQGGDGMPAFAALGWAAAHGAYARQGAQAALSEVVGLRVAVEKLSGALAAQGGGGVDAAALQQAVRDGVAQALADSVEVRGQLDVVARS